MNSTFEDYGNCVCHLKEAMDKAGITISKMTRLTGINITVVKKYYEDESIRIDKDVFSRMAFVLWQHNVNITNLIEYIPPKK